MYDRIIEAFKSLADGLSDGQGVSIYASLQVICSEYCGFGNVLRLYEQVPMSHGFDQEITNVL